VDPAHLLLAAALSMSIGDFIELQKLSAPELRTRFSLPAACDPSLAALTTDPAANRVTVAVDCRALPGRTQPEQRPASTPQQPAQKDIRRR
jgi:hypothetical protein